MPATLSPCGSPLVVVRESPIHGRGLFAALPLEADRMIGFYSGEVTLLDGPHVLWVEEDNGEAFGIDGACELRFANHSHAPNAVFLGEELWTLGPIEAGDEITFDYGPDWTEESPDWSEDGPDWSGETEESFAG